MKYSSVLATTSTLLSVGFAATIPSQQPWSTLTPSASAPSGAQTDYSQRFGIQIVTVDASVSASPSSQGGKRRRNFVQRDGSVNQIGDGQIQAQSLVYSTPSPTAAPSVVNQIGDGQIQHQTASVVNQIGDGQIQHQTASVVNQIGDGQIQHQTASVVNQIGDGQIQHQNSTASAINQIGDGQIQNQANSTANAASQIGDGQVQETSSPNASGDNSKVQACASDNALSMTLNKGILNDSKGRVGAIVSNRQFQFDGPPPQSGSIYAAGWSVTADGYLALGDQTEFYQCQSGDFYNLYDENVAHQCAGVKLSIVDFVDC